MKILQRKIKIHQKKKKGYFSREAKEKLEYCKFLIYIKKPSKENFIF